MKEWWTAPVRMFLCDRSRRTHGLTVVESHVDWDGVLHIEELTPPKPPHRPRPSVQGAPTDARRTTTGAAPRGAHVPHEHPDVPGVWGV